MNASAQEPRDDVASALSLLVAARNLFGSSGNRRKLFNRFDEILSIPTVWAAMEWNPTATGTTRPFRFSRISLRNWKAFERADFDFVVRQGRPVVLIGGNNGNGKTSILEALATGLYGVHAHIDRARLTREGNDSGATRRSGYRRAIDRAMHRQSFERGDRDMSVVITIESEGNLFEIERRWYFGDNGSFVEDDEELILREGEDRHILSPPSDVTASEFAAQEIERRVAPASMLPFLLFDGEQIRRLADRELSEQVRFGLESALSVASIRGLIEDLSDYAKDRGRDLQADGIGASLAAQVEALNAQFSAARGDLAEVEEALLILRRERDEIVRSIGSIGDGTYLERHVDIEARKKAEAELHTARHDLLVGGVRLLPFRLIPRDLLDRTERALSAAAGSLALAPGQDCRILEELVEALKLTEPPLDPQAMNDLIRRTEEAWETSIGAAEAGAGPVMHGYLNGHDSRRVMDMLVSLRLQANVDIEGMLGRIQDLRRLIDGMEDDDLRRRNAEGSRIDLAKDLEAVGARIAELEGRRRRLDQVAGKLEAQIEPLQADLERKRMQRRGVGSGLRTVEAAVDAAKALEIAVSNAMPKHYHSLAAALGEVYRGLAHKGIVQDVAIAPDGTVSLLDSKGRDLRDTDASAGENQIFAMALIAAISGLSGVALPLVIDTPLGRLDTGHRDRVLDYFTSRSAQTVLLSQPEEVAGRYYDRIAPRICSEYHLIYRSEDGGLGQTIVEKGYFPRIAA